MRVTTEAINDPFAPVWPEGFPREAEVACGVCGAGYALDSPFDFTVRHQPPNRDDPAYTPPKRVPETGVYVAADASGTVPIDPEGERFVIEYTCPKCGAIQRTEV